MQKELMTFVHPTGLDKDYNIISRLTLIFNPDDESVYFEIRRTEGRMKYDEYSKKEEIELQMEILEIEKLEIVATLVENWLGSQSQSRLFRSLTDIEAQFKITKDIDTHNQDVKSVNSDSISVKVDELSIEFSTKHEDEWVGVEIPTGERKEGEVVKDVTNLRKFSDFLYDFYNIEYTGGIPNVYGGSNQSAKTASDKIELIFERFDKMANQLSTRREDREPLRMEDEYDVQYLLHSILRLYFDDIRDESYLKQHAGVNPRIDFLIEEENIGIEAKFVSDTRSPKRIRAEIAEDKEQYKSDEMVEKLLCFIYDPDRHMRNPAEYEKDLGESSRGLTTRVTVVPR